MDVIIRNGTVVDGTGAPSFVADVGIRGDRISFIGDLSAERSATEIDASGKLVTPGFIDAHAHSDAYLLLEPDAPSKLSQGITTEINGQCGGSAAPRLGSARLSSDWASQVYPRLDDGARIVGNDLPGPTWDTFDSYRELFEAVAPAVNSIQFVGHNTLRAGVMGYEAREASDDEIKEMERRLEEALECGAWGLTTGLLYQPGKYSSNREVEALAACAARKGGVYATHMRSEGDRLLESVDEVLELARRTGIRVEISHLKTSGRANWPKIDALLEKIECARAEGLAVHSDRYPFLAAGTDLDVVLPDWAGAGGRDAELSRIADPATRQLIVEELNASPRDWGDCMIGGTWSELTGRFRGKTVAAAAETLGLTPGETVCDFIEADQTRTGAFFFGMSPDNLHRIYEKSWVMPGSDASLRAPTGPLGFDYPHPRAYGTMPRFFRMLTGREEGFARIATREEAVRRMCSLPADAFGISGRGRLREGCFADVAVWDEERFENTARYDAPHSFCTGVEAVFVNGVLSYRNGVFTGVRRGRLLAR